MATYKVPQDVEAEDKIIGFLSLKQFIFVIIMVASIWLEYLLAKANIVLAIPLLPITIVCGVLGLYQRRDQPVEVFLASWLRFKIKPRKRTWDQEGFEERVIITVPKALDTNYTKGLSQDQVASRLNQLSSMLDSRGWASKHGVQTLNTGQRLFNADELSRYARPTLPLDGEASHVVDQYDTGDPRNRTMQEVDRDFNSVAKRQHKEALEVVERARKEALQATPTPIAPPIKPAAKTPSAPRSTPSRPLKTTPATQEIEHAKTPKTAPKPAAPKPDATEGKDGEVVINLHHKK